MSYSSNELKKWYKFEGSMSTSVHSIEFSVTQFSDRFIINS